MDSLTDRLNAALSRRADRGWVQAGQAEAALAALVEAPTVGENAERVGAIAKRFGLVYVDQADPPGPASPDWTSRHIPLHATSSGKVFLAWLPEEERAGVLPPHLERYTQRTVTDRDQLDADLADVRRRGFSTCIGELEDHSNGVSAAILNRLKRPVAVVNIWGPGNRVTVRRLPVLGRTALSLAHEISLVLD